MTNHAARTQNPLSDMMEATRLTGLGRLDEASALIQRSLNGAAPSPTVGAYDPAALRLRSPAPGMRPEPAETTLVAERVREVIGSVVRGLGRGAVPMLKGLGGQTMPPAPREPSRRPDGGNAFIDQSFANAAGARDYKLFVPSRPQSPAPLVVMLHGCTQSPDDFAAGTGMNALAEREGIYVAYPAQSRHANGQKCWNWFEPRDQGRESGESGIIAGLTRAVMEGHDIDPSRVYIAGLSAGGAAAANIALAYPDLYAAVGVHSGLAAGCARDLGSAMMAMQMGAPGTAQRNGFGAASERLRLPTIVIHGADDTTVNARNADQVLAQAGVEGLVERREHVEGEGRPFTRTRYADPEGRTLVESWRVHGAGHAWAGGDANGSYTDPAGPDASRAMLDFFAAHRLVTVRN